MSLLCLTKSLLSSHCIGGRAFVIGNESCLCGCWWIDSLGMKSSSSLKGGVHTAFTSTLYVVYRYNIKYALVLCTGENRFLTELIVINECLAT
ncbi:hypothetical protein F4820DRAFT_385864 [Hypoxylon rubiginosum]|uniref:Uncharacterized protein n=1 Tax=Hypoxylon rubiginosum TaxID=110542 RepID=A0ACB9ZDN7_9PEZI|nr:hypothetical protein F4820DRAFT_385864 [Hypoxylon rubiginosum]